MQYLKLGLKGCMCMTISVYLTALVAAQTLTTSLQIVLVYFYFLCLTLTALLCYQKFLSGKQAKQIWRIMLISVVLALLCFLSCRDVLVPKAARATSITITATGEQNENAQGMEVRITAIRVNGKTLDLKKLPLTEGWEIDEYGGLVYVPDGRTVSLPINLEKALQIEISFLSHPWSGIVEVQEGAKKTILDLYHSETTDCVYEVQSNTYVQGYWIHASAFLFLALIFFVFLRLSEAYNHKWLIPVGIFCTLLTISTLVGHLAERYEPGFMGKVFAAIIVGVALTLPNDMVKKWTWYHWTMFVLVDAIIVFQFIAQFLFMEPMQSTITLQQITLYLLICVVCAPVLLLICHAIDWLDRRIRLPAKNVLYKKANKSWWFALPFIIFFGAFSLAYQLLPEFISVSYRPTKVTIMLMEDKNPESQGYEALLSMNAFIDGAPVPISPIETIGNWNQQNDYLWGKSPNSKITLSFPQAEDIDLQFNKHAWSGIVEITDGEYVTQIDLYSSTIKDYMVNYHVKGNLVYGLSPVANLLLSLLCALVVAGIIYFLIYTTIRETSSRLYALALFLTITCIWSGYLCAGNPGSVTIDTISQFSQAKGVLPITDAHPALLTIWYRLLFRIMDSPVLISLFQIMVFALVVAVFLQYISLHGISRKIISLFAILFGLHLVNGVYASTLWKDVPFTVCLLWLMLLMVKFATEKRLFFSWSNIFQTAFCMALTVLLRHNGIIILIATMILLVFAMIIYHSLRPAVALILGILIFTGVKGSVYKAFDVVPNPIYSPYGLLHGMVYTELITGDGIPLLKELAPIEDWALMYEPYSANSFAFSPIAQKNDLEEKLQAIDSARVIKAYIQTAMKHPFLMIKDRLFGCNLLWNSIPSGYNWRVGNDQYRIVVTGNDFGFYCRENLLTEVIDNAYQISVQHTLTDMIIWRAGPYLTITLLLLFMGLIKRKYGLFLLGLPLLGNSLSLVLAMSWQDYRYVYFVFVCTCFLILSYFAIPLNEKEGSRTIVYENTNYYPSL